MQTMTALRAHTRGGPERLAVEQAPVPDPGPGEVLVAVRAAAITFAELGWDETWTRDGVDRTPIIPSHEMSGVVVDHADDVRLVRAGDEVYGLVPFDRDGAAAEFVVLPDIAVAPKPATRSHLESAALPLAGLTAWQALVTHAGVAPGERVLVHGGAGGVGAFAVQLAASLGARVTATSHSRDVPFVEGLGAEQVVDVDVERFDAIGRSYDVVVDTVGGETLERSYAVLRPKGRLVTLQAPPSEELASPNDIVGMFFIVTADREQLIHLAHLVDAEGLRVTLAATFPLVNGRAAYESGAGPGRRPGKTVLEVS